MTDYFDTKIKSVITVEGGYVNHADDSGKATRWGTPQP